VADYLSGGSGRHAEFVFDAPGRFVVAEDDEARWMVGEQTSVKGPQPRTTPGPRRLSAVDAGDILPLGEDAIEMVAEDSSPAAAGTADWMATQATARPAGDPVEETVELGSEADEPDTSEPSETSEPAQPRAAKKGRRPSVPSWDEIMFGGGKRE